ncbi:L-histidine N(alpha)-methyltransferase [Nocardioides limicola]|uniref:L-histidine N(alpha)-methyltransferase n=1 Tax=Nocardioides limicola TaxID=2803368 RepID=UPI00193BC813|nr:L-histidine N(alpha)-methyltransferase [Nocardioides sp. DJM-14]
MTDTWQVLLDSSTLRGHLVEDARIGLTAAEKWLPPKYFYDDLGSDLFDQITRLPEYYPTRAEQGLLDKYADEIAAVAGAEMLLELGSGSSEKTRVLLDALDRTGHLVGYSPVDVSAGALRAAVAGLRADYPTLPVHATIADFDVHLDELPAPGSRMIAFLGSTLGNYPPEQRAVFLSGLAQSMHAGETLLLGLDLVKEPARLVAAYDDAAGVTAEFNRNVLRVLNRELNADFDPDRFAHVARWDPEQEWIQMRLRATEQMQVQLADLGLTVTFARGEEIRTEISAKFRRDRIAAELREAGLTCEHWWTDDDYALTLARRLDG